MDKLRKKLIRIFIGIPIKGEPIVSKNIHRIVMPIEGVSMEEWAAGKWHHAFNKV